MRIVDVLKKTRKVLDAPEKWIQGTWAADADGLPAHTSDAAMWSLCGATEKVIREHWKSDTDMMNNQIMRLTAVTQIAYYKTLAGMDHADWDAPLSESPQKRLLRWEEDLSTSYADVIALVENTIKAIEALPNSQFLLMVEASLEVSVDGENTM